MSEYLSKKALLDSMNEQEKVYRGYGLHPQADTVKWWIAEIESGTFNVTLKGVEEYYSLQYKHGQAQQEIQRLRLVLEQARRCLLANAPKTALTHIEDALSTTTELAPFGHTDDVQRLRAALEEVYEELKILHFMIDHDDDIFHERKKKYLSIIDYVGQSVAGQALSTTTEPTGPYTIRRDVTAGINTKGQPFAVAIERNGYTVLHLQPGTERNEGEVEHIVDLLNNRSPEQHLMWEIKGLLENWDFRGIAGQLESGYDQGVVVELVELCEMLTGAKSPKVSHKVKIHGINTPKGDGNDA